jgi:hypothetical protein
MSVYALFDMKYCSWFVVLEPRFRVPRLKYGVGLLDNKPQVRFWPIGSCSQVKQGPFAAQNLQLSVVTGLNANRSNMTKLSSKHAWQGCRLYIVCIAVRSRNKKAGGRRRSKMDG